MAKQNKKDPTGTAGLRRKAVSKVNKKYNELYSAVYKTLITNKLFTNIEAIPEDQFSFLDDPQKVEEFEKWLGQSLYALFLLDPEGVEGLLRYITVAYEEGVLFTDAILKAPIGLDISSLSLPRYTEAIKMLNVKGISQLKGITSAVAQQITRELTEGILNKEGIRQIVKRIKDRVNKIGVTRTRLLVRTEIVGAYQRGVADQGNFFSEYIGEPVYYRWQTAQDGNVRHTHVERNQKVYTYEKVTTLLGEPNCRCSIIPLVSSDLEEGEEVIDT